MRALILLAAVTGLGHAAKANDILISDSIPKDALVFVESFDEAGRSMSTGIGIMVKKGFVALNYHFVAGAKEVIVTKPGDSQKYPSDGYLSVEESQDLIIISVPELNGRFVTLGGFSFPKDGEQVQLTCTPEHKRLQFSGGIVNGSKEIRSLRLPQILAQNNEECHSGPIFQDGRVVGFAVAGYRDEGKQFSYAVPVSELKRLMNRSFIIKAFNSVSDAQPIGPGHFQASLMESLTAVLWLPMEDAEKLARKKQKMILIDVSTKWAGWSLLMDKNTYGKKSIIRYLNENFYCVRLDAESQDTVFFNRLSYFRSSGSTYHTLAYSLLEGKMDFPSTVILDEEINELMVIPGYMDAQKMEVVLHYFNEKAYLNEKLSFQQFESRYWERRNTLEDN